MDWLHMNYWRGHIKTMLEPRFPNPDLAAQGKYATLHFPCMQRTSTCALLPWLCATKCDTTTKWITTIINDVVCVLLQILLTKNLQRCSSSTESSRTRFSPNNEMWFVLQHLKLNLFLQFKAIRASILSSVSNHKTNKYQKIWMTVQSFPHMDVSAWMQPSHLTLNLDYRVWITSRLLWAQ